MAEGAVQRDAEARPTEIEVIARAVLWSGDHLLLCESVPHGYRYLPGGHIEPGEAAAEGLRRELEEEAGLGDAIVGRCLLVAEQRFVQRGRARHELLLVFHVEHPRLTGAATPPPIDALEPGIAYGWVARAGLPAAPGLPAGRRGRVLEPFPKAPEWISRPEDPGNPMPP